MVAYALESVLAKYFQDENANFTTRSDEYRCAEKNKILFQFNELVKSEAGQNLFSIGDTRGIDARCFEWVNKWVPTRPVVQRLIFKQMYDDLYGDSKNIAHHGDSMKLLLRQIIETVVKTHESELKNAGEITDDFKKTVQSLTKLSSIMLNWLQTLTRSDGFMYELILNVTAVNSNAAGLIFDEDAKNYLGDSLREGMKRCEECMKKSE